MLHETEIDKEHLQHDDLEEAFIRDTESMEDCDSFDMEHEHMLHDVMHDVMNIIDNPVYIARSADRNRGMELESVSSEEELIEDMAEGGPRPLWPPNDEPEGYEAGKVYTDDDQDTDPVIVVKMEPHNKTIKEKVHQMLLLRSC